METAVPRATAATGAASSDDPPTPADLRLAVVAPAFNEVDNVGPLYEAVRDALGPSQSWELVLVDDGSDDGTGDAVRGLARGDPRVRGVHLPRRCGQTSALCAGIRAARAPLVATLDADLQNDPADIPALVEGLGQADAIVGYRARRQDSWVRLASSRIANAVRNWATKDRVRDTGCGLKLFRREAIRAIPLFEGMHRFLPTLLRMHGYTVLEAPVSHHPRVRGKSKYGIHNRLWRGIRDLVAVRWMRSRAIAMRDLERSVRED